MDSKGAWATESSLLSTRDTPEGTLGLEEMRMGGGGTDRAEMERRKGE
jgi:hypothetical protein